MYFHLEEIKMGDSIYLSELTWAFPRQGQWEGSHYPIRHPEAAELDLTLAEMDPDYTPPFRYSDLVVGTAFLADYDRLPPATPIVGTSPEQCRALRSYLGYVPHSERALPYLRVMTDGFTPTEISRILQQLSTTRRRAIEA